MYDDLPKEAIAEKHKEALLELILSKEVNPELKERLEALRSILRKEKLATRLGQIEDNKERRLNK